MSTALETRRFFYRFPGDVYAIGPTTKGYPWNDTDEIREETIRQVREDIARQWDCEPNDFEVWPASPHEYGYGKSET